MPGSWRPGGCSWISRQAPGTSGGCTGEWTFRIARENNLKTGEWNMYKNAGGIAKRHYTVEAGFGRIGGYHG